MLEWIDIVGEGGGQGEDRASSLSWSDKNPMVLTVTGVLPHGYKFEPRSIEAAELFIEYLENWIENADEDED